MKPEYADSLDEMIDDALRSEALRPLPPGFHRATEERVRIAALLLEERRRFRVGMLRAGLFVLALSGVTGFLAVWGDVAGALARSIPGALGFYDRALSGAPGFAGSAVLLACVLGLTSLLVEARLAAGSELARAIRSN